MATVEIVMAGFGGQGMLLSGKLLAYAAMKSGKEVSWLPSYGPEMRGGTANVTVCVSDRPVGSPVSTAPNALLVMNQPSLEKFGNAVKPGGVVVVNTSLVPITCPRKDVTVIELAANDLAAKVATVKAANLVMLGAYVGASDIIDPDKIRKVIEHEFARKPKFIPGNIAAFDAGYNEARRMKGGA